MNYNKFKYYLNRVKNSSFKFLVRKLFDKIMKDFYFRFKYKNFKCKTSFINEFKKINIILDPAEISFLRERVQYVVTKGRWDCLGYGFVDVDSDDCFLTDDVHGFVWQRQYFSDIDFLNIASYSDVKIPWEKSRLQFLAEICLYISNANKDDDCLFYKNFVLNTVKKWDRENPFLYSVNWISSMEVALRSTNVIFAFCLISEYLDDADKNFISSFLYKHMLYIDLFPEYSDVPGNHYLSTLCGKAILYDYFNLPSKVLKEIIYQIEIQFNTDKIHYEFSPLYHRLCTEMLLSIFVLNKNLPEFESSEILIKINEFINTSIYLSDHYSLLMPVISDSDSGKVFDFGQLDRDVSIFTKNNKSLASSIISKIFQLVTFEKQIIKTTIYCMSRVEPFYILKVPRLSVFYKSGNLGLKGRASHDHDDNLSFWAFYKGLDFIVEKGTMPYTLSVKDREKCISSSSHNVVYPTIERNVYKQGSIYKTVECSSVPHKTSFCDTNAISEISFVNAGFDQIRKIHFEDSILTLNDSILNSVSAKKFISRIHFSKHSSFCCLLDKTFCIFINNEFVEISLECESNIVFSFNTDFFEYGLKYGCYESGQRLSIIFDNSINFSYSLKFIFPKLDETANGF